MPGGQRAGAHVPPRRAGVARPGHELGNHALPPRATKLEPPAGAFTLAAQELSSSEVRKRLHYMPTTPHSGEDGPRLVKGRNYAMVEGLVPPAVLAHIGRYQLYAEEDPGE